MGLPRKSMVAVMVGVGSPKTTSIFPEAVATALSSGRNTVVGAWGASLVNPAPRDDGDRQQHQDGRYGLDRDQPTQGVKDLGHARYRPFSPGALMLPATGSRDTPAEKSSSAFLGG